MSTGESRRSARTESLLVRVDVQAEGYRLSSRDEVRRVRCILREWLIKNDYRFHKPHIECPRLSLGCKFPYHEIDATNQIRIFELLPGDAQDPLYGRLVTEDIDSVTSFDAVSYAWGSRRISGSVQCDGAELRINQSVSEMLHHFRDPQAVRRLWIDAICIDQSHEVEKPAQVKIMDRIYETASTVVVWLGKEEETTKLALDTIELAFEALKLSQAEVDPTISLIKIKRCGFPLQRNAGWEAVETFLGHSWFSRTWILQEVALARRVVVHCGQHQCEWHKLAQLALSMLRLQLDRAVAMENIASAALIAAVASEDHSNYGNLLGHLVSTTIRQASNPRDKVFALLGIASDGPKFSHLVNYKIDVGVLFANVSRIYIEQGNLDLLSWAGDRPWHRYPHIPSWAVDWHSHNRPLSLSNLIYANSHTFKWDVGRAVVSPDYKILLMKGIIRGRVRSVGTNLPVPSKDVNSPREARIVQQWHGLATECDRYPTGEESREVFARTIVLARLVWKPATFETIRELYDAYIARSLQTETLSGDRTERENDIFYYREGLNRACERRSFFKTFDGYIGLGSFFLRPGDLLVVLSGAKTPFAIRPTRKGRYELIGEAYIYGQMGGEGLDMNAVQDFEIV